MTPSPPTPSLAMGPSPHHHLANHSQTPAAPFTVSGERDGIHRRGSLPPRRGCFSSCVGRACWAVSQLEGRFLPPEVMIHAGSRLHICLLGGSGRGKQSSACERGEGCLQHCDGVRGPESGELMLRAVYRGSGMLIIGLGPAALDVGARSCVRT